eukprot:scaffold69026_cov19-Tisochrysis_lutea.AAC.1
MSCTVAHGLGICNSGDHPANTGDHPAKPASCRAQLCMGMAFAAQLCMGLACAAHQAPNNSSWLRSARLESLLLALGVHVLQYRTDLNAKPSKPFVMNKQPCAIENRQQVLHPGFPVSIRVCWPAVAA